MSRVLVSFLSVMGLLGVASATYADVAIRVPFVRVYVGDGVNVRAPFVNIWVPNSRPVYYVPSQPPVVMPPAREGAKPEQAPAPRPVDPNAPPAPVQETKPMTLTQFANAFEPRAGNYEVTVVNPVTGTPANVRFSLPEGSPRRVNVYARELEYYYGPRQYVRIQFDRDGAIVTSR
jgi:hypothetical protein